MQKTEIPGIYKASEGVLINKDNEALTLYKKRKEQLWEKEQRINRMEQKVEKLSNDLDEIKNLLIKLTER